MNEIYFILAVTGWVWLLIVAALLPVLLWWHDRRRREQRGFALSGTSDDVMRQPGSSENETR